MMSITTTIRTGNSRGALIGFNSIATAAGHADWWFDPQTVLAAPVELAGGGRALGSDLPFMQKPHPTIRHRFCSSR
jgi:hypothetical protein